MSEATSAVIAVTEVAQRRNLDHITGLWGVDHLSPADVDPDMGQSIEEDEVARLKLVTCDGRTEGVLRGGEMRQRNAKLAQALRGQATAR